MDLPGWEGRPCWCSCPVGRMLLSKVQGWERVRIAARGGVEAPGPTGTRHRPSAPFHVCGHSSFPMCLRHPRLLGTSQWLWQACMWGTRRHSKMPKRWPEQATSHKRQETQLLASGPLALCCCSMGIWLSDFKFLICKVELVPEPSLRV